MKKFIISNFSQFVVHLTMVIDLNVEVELFPSIFYFFFVHFCFSKLGNNLHWYLVVLYINREFTYFALVVMKSKSRKVFKTFVLRFGFFAHADVWMLAHHLVYQNSN